MSKGSKIEWTDHTFNAWLGCEPVSPGCDHCYAEVSTPVRVLGVKFGTRQPRHRTSAENWKQPLRWEREHAQFYEEHGRRQRVFSASLSDWLDNAVPIEWLVDLLDLVRRTPSLAPADQAHRQLQEAAGRSQRLRLEQRRRRYR